MTGCYFSSGECGSWKTSTARAHIIATPGRYIFAVPRIDLMEEMVRDFRAKRGGAREPVIQAIHSDPARNAAPIGTEITRAITALTTHSHAVLFVTHQALALMDWSRAELAAHGWHLVVDEIPEIWAYAQFNFSASHEVMRELFQVESFLLPDGTASPDWVTATLTTEGHAIRQDRKDDFHKQFPTLWPMLAPNRICVAQADFFNEAATGDAHTTLLLGSVLEPDHLAPFASRWFLGANFTQSLLYRLWSQRGATLTERPLPTIVTRTTPISQRVRIHYFSERNASDTFFRDDSKPLALAAEWLNQNLTQPFYYCFNEDHQIPLTGHIPLTGADEKLATKRTPKQSGSNDLLDHTHAVWLAAMNPSDAEVSVIANTYNISRDEVLQAREREAMYQFVMRSNLRDFTSNLMVDVYVFSRAQAEALATMLGGGIIRHIPVGIALKTAKEQNRDPHAGGRKPAYATDAERKAAKKDQDRQAQQRRRERLRATQSAKAA